LIFARQNINVRSDGKEFDGGDKRGTLNDEGKEEIILNDDNVRRYISKVILLVE
jgi:hypothetical protein